MNETYRITTTTTVVTQRWVPGRGDEEGRWINESKTETVVSEERADV